MGVRSESPLPRWATDFGALAIRVSHMVRNKAHIMNDGPIRNLEFQEEPRLIIVWIQNIVKVSGNWVDRMFYNSINHLIYVDKIF